MQEEKVFTDLLVFGTKLGDLKLEPDVLLGVRCNVESANLEILNVESLNVEQYNEFLLRCQMSETARRRR